ncbi:MAG TPA: Uma2 family endonuclease [Methylomirabilota bacterium]|nr:Uma2 family endonuclease [Methylomirabilota bacterium]
MAIEIIKHRFTVEEYHRMGEAGIFAEDDRVELIQGEIVEMTPIGPRHSACVARLTHLFSGGLAGRVVVWVQNPIRIGPDSEPQPDVVLLRPRADFYQEAHPGPLDIFVVVEVRDTSAAYDRTVKLLLYARAGIPEVWLVDLESHLVEVHRNPGTSGYQNVQQLRRGQHLAAEALSGPTFSVSDILG